MPFRMRAIPSYLLHRCQEMGYAELMRSSQLSLFIYFALLVISSVGSAAPPRKLALLVGLSRYSHSGPHDAQPWWALHGQADVDHLEKVLIQNLGFAAADVQVLRNEAATKLEVRQAFLTHLIEKARPGDQILFHFSGHGQQLPDDNGDEQDGLDESLVPHDAYDTSVEVGARTNIRDDEVGTWLAQLQAKMSVDGKLAGTILVTLDSCFSGTATRGGAVRGRAWDPAHDGPLPTGSLRGQADGDSGFLPRGEASRMGYVLLTASRSDQLAGERGGMGIFSQALVKALASLDPQSGTTGRSLHSRISTKMVQEDAEQEPQIEGAADVALFSDGTRMTDYRTGSLQVIQKPGQPLVLRGGEIHGVTAGSIYQLYAQDLGSIDWSKPLAEAKVEEVFPFESHLRLTSHFHPNATQQALTNLLALEKEHYYGSRQLKLYLAGPNPLPELRPSIAQLSMVTTSEATAVNHDLALSYDGVRLQLRRAGERIPFKVFEVRGNAPVDLSEILEKAWMWRYLTGLTNHKQAAQLDLKLVPIAGALSSPANTSVENGLRSGSQFKLEFHNHAGSARYVTVLELADDGDITILYPDKRDLNNNLLAPTSPAQPPRQSYETYQLDVTKRTRRSLLKVFVTEQPLSFEGVFSRAGTTRGEQAGWLPGYDNPLSLFLRRAKANHRGAGSAANQVTTAGWSTSEVWLRVIP